MNLNNFFHTLDKLLEQKKLDEAEEHLIFSLKEAMAEEDTSAVLTVMSELIGLYRVTGRHEEGIMFADKSMLIAKSAGMEGTEGYATIVLNSATEYRAAGRFKEAEELYEEAAGQLKASGCQDGYRYASLYNNISLLYQETGRDKEAVKELHKALEIIRGLPDCLVEEATTYTNLALVYIKLEEYDRAEEELKKALAIFERDKGNEFKDAHYGAALSAYGDLYYKRGSYEKAADIYERALSEISRSYGERNSSYEMTCENCIEACCKAGYEERAKEHQQRLSMLREKGQRRISGMELSRKYYEAYGRRMIHEKFPEYENRIAVGLCGHGSECFGFDDMLSEDHDYGPAFCMWLTGGDHEKIGQELQREYEKLPKSFMGVPERKIMPTGKLRVGVQKISGFYEEHIKRGEAPARDDAAGWNDMPEAGLAAATNGEVFADALGEFTRIREELLAYYPQRLWRGKLAECAARMAQYGQYNYARCMEREDHVAALQAYTGFIQESIRLIFLVYRRYMPYYKWSYRGAKELAEGLGEEPLSTIVKGIGELAETDYRNRRQTEDRIEEICTLTVKLLRDKGLSKETDPYMERQAQSIMEGKGMKEKETEEKKTEKEELTDAIVKAEWDMFQATRNEGGRADCQDNWNTFRLMRSSQFMAWEEEMLASYLADLRDGEREGRNLITEKYGRMMESTAPERYAAIKENFPVISPERKAISEQVIAIQVGWLEEFCSQYPKLSKQIRYIHTSEDTPYDTSAETYLRGELDTYSENTFLLYCRYVVRLSREGKNLNRRIMENTVLQYGYSSLEDAERRLE